MRRVADDFWHRDGDVEAFNASAASDPSCRFHRAVPAVYDHLQNVDVRKDVVWKI